MKFLDNLQPLGLLILRFALGLIFFTNGYPKLWHPTADMFHFFTQHGLPAYSLYVTGILEAFGGALLVIGLFTRAVALLLAIEMGLAIWKFHSGSILAVNTYGYQLMLATASFALATVGAGVVSVDEGILGSSGRTTRPSRKPAKD